MVKVPRPCILERRSVGQGASAPHGPARRGHSLDATRIDDVVLVLRSQGLQRAALADGSSKLLLRFDVPALSGALMPQQMVPRLSTYAAVDDLTAEFSIGLRIGLY